MGGIAGAAVFGGCMFATAGAGSIGCGIAAGAVYGAVSNLWKSTVQKTQKFSWGGLAKDTVIGGVSSAVGGPLVGKIAAKIAPSATLAASAAIRASMQRARAVVANKATAAAAAVKQRVSGAVQSARSQASTTTGSSGAAAKGRLFEAVNDRAEQIYLTQSGSERGPVLSGVMDRKTGRIAFGQNTGVPENLHPALRARLDAFEGPGAEFKGIPGSHAEVNGVNELLFARSGSTISDMMVFNMRLKGAQKGQPIVMCPNCAQILRGAEDLS